YMDSQDSFQQATPDYVKEAGAKGYNNTFWTPYINDEVFLEKFTRFIEAFGEEYNDPSKVDFVDGMGLRSEEHTSELQSRFDLVCRLLLEKKKLQATIIEYEK